MTSIAQLQNSQIDAFAVQLAQSTQAQDAKLTLLRESVSTDARANREETGAALQNFGEKIARELNQLAQMTEQRLAEVRGTLEARLKDLQLENANKLEEMRKTVDEKLQSTLHARLGESFSQVSERLEAVQRGLGEMQVLAAGVGDLKRVLTNVKSRGTWGEVQLGNLLEQILVSEQYAKNVATVPGSAERVEFAIRLPGLDESQPVWLPIDAKFPREDYERLLDAHDRADTVAADEAGRQLEARIRLEARTIRDKYLAPPATTDFAVMFLPTEGLFAEVIRRPGLADELQRLYRVSVAGPTTLTALLNSLQMGFRTLAIQQRSSEVWVLLGAVKNEFEKFGGVLDRVKKQLTSATRSLDDAGRRSRAIERRLRSVEELPASMPGLDLSDAALDADSSDDEAGDEEQLTAP
jgi:DNA recombination protein RmuC